MVSVNLTKLIKTCVTLLASINKKNVCGKVANYGYYFTLIFCKEHFVAMKMEKSEFQTSVVCGTFVNKIHELCKLCSCREAYYSTSHSFTLVSYKATSENSLSVKHFDTFCCVCAGTFHVV